MGTTRCALLVAALRRHSSCLRAAAPRAYRAPSAPPTDARPQVIGQQTLVEMERAQRAASVAAVQQLVAERRAAAARLDVEAASLAKAEQSQTALATALLNLEPGGAGT